MGGWAGLDLCIVFEPLIHPSTYYVLSHHGHVQALDFFNGRFRVCLSLGPAQDVLVDRLSGLQIVPGCVATLPAATFSFSDVFLWADLPEGMDTIGIFDFVFNTKISPTFPAGFSTRSARRRSSSTSPFWAAKLTNISKNN